MDRVVGCEELMRGIILRIFFWGLKWLCWSISGIFQSETFSSSTFRMRYTQANNNKKKYNGWIEARKRKESESICCLQLLKVNCPLRISWADVRLCKLYQIQIFFLSILFIFFSLACRRRLNKIQQKICKKKILIHIFSGIHETRQCKISEEIVFYAK